jgi:two-component system, NarL family, invasion response regulator UvrY
MVRMLIADDHPLVRQRLKQLLLEEFPSAFFELAKDTDSLLKEALSNEWDVIISDLVMPGGGGLQALKKIKQVKPSSLVIITSIYPEEQYSSRAISEGAAAFLNKNNADAELVNTVKYLLEGVAKRTT